MRAFIFGGPVLALVLASPVLQAETVALRSFVATTGSDANVSTFCQRTAPCRTFTAALTITATSGAITALDSGFYSPVVIGKSVSLVAAPGVTAGITQISAASAAVTVSGTASTVVVLRGLTLMGRKAGLKGIDITGAGAVFVEDVVIEDFASHGIQMQTDRTELSIKDTVVRGNGFHGLAVFDTQAATTPRIVVERSRFENNAGNGLQINGADAVLTGVRSSGNNEDGLGVRGSRVSVTDSTLAHNLSDGASLITQASVVFEHTTIAGNQFNGLTVALGSTATLSNCSVTHNRTGVINLGATIETRQNNLVRENTTNTSGALTPVGGI